MRGAPLHCGNDVGGVSAAILQESPEMRLSSDTGSDPVRSTGPSRDGTENRLGICLRASGTYRECHMGL